jgi:DNA-binding GntR family transcriptional regulator
MWRFQSVSPRKNQAYEDLRFRIISNELIPGEILNEKELMGRYEIGRTPLREILLLLQRDGLIKMIPRLGTIVSSPDIRQMKDIIEIRRELEGLVGQLAAERITEEQLSGLREILDKVKEYKQMGSRSVKELGEYEHQFHNILYEATGNLKLISVLTEFQGIMARFWHQMKFPFEVYLNAFDDLEQVLKALEKRDVNKAREALVSHVNAFVGRVKEGIL